MMCQHDTEQNLDELEFYLFSVAKQAFGDKVDVHFNYQNQEIVIVGPGAGDLRINNENHKELFKSFVLID